MAKTKSRAEARRRSSGPRKAASPPKDAPKMAARGRASAGTTSKAKPAAGPGRADPKHIAETSKASLRNPEVMIGKDAASAKAGPHASGPKAATAAIAKGKELLAEGPKVPNAAP